MRGAGEDGRPARGPDAARRERRLYRFRICGRHLLILLLAEIGFTLSAFLISRCEYITLQWTFWYTFIMWFGAAVTFLSIIACADTLKLCICEDGNISGYNTSLRVLTTMVILGFLGIQAFIFLWRYRYGCPSSSNISLGRLARSASDEEWAATYELRLVPHEAWSNRSEAGLPRLRQPAPFAVLSHIAGPSCSGLTECTPLLLPETQHNFLIDSAGYVYVGRGADVVSAIESVVGNCSLGVALLGDYDERDVSQEAVAALQRLLEVGVASGWLAADYRLVAHSQLGGAEPRGPGQRALAAVHSWPRRCLVSCSQGLTCPAP